jgi:hypothetical protein
MRPYGGVAEHIAITSKAAPKLDVRRTQNLYALEIRVGASLLAMNEYTFFQWLLVRLNLKHYSFYRQLRQHDDLLNCHGVCRCTLLNTHFELVPIAGKPAVAFRPVSNNR